MFAFPLVFSYVHRYYGSQEFARQTWPHLQAYAMWLQRMAGTSKTGLISWYKYGDWLEPGRVASTGLIGAMSSAFNMIQTMIIAQSTARALNDTAAFLQYTRAVQSLREKFHSKYFVPSNNTYGDGSQAAMVYALYIDAVPVSIEPKVLNNLYELIQSPTWQCTTPPCIDTGILATKW